MALLAVLGALVAVPAAATPSWAATSNVTVSFGTTVRSVSRTQFGLDVTGYGYGNYITNDAAKQAMLNGRHGVMGMGLKYSTPGEPNSTIVANGAGADTTVTGDQWVSFIQTFPNIGGTRTDFIDFHQYGEGGSTLLCDSQLLASTSQWESNVNRYGQ